ncbi:DUF1015 family protein [Sediminibacterium sp.]|uniref:DUF1015 domain-containing protein n=1 Tax=Sediminibacterium sp. TaxID=1917865 RepID=UPI0025CC09F5|nr:DUF1015 family protein [Sediminibacterium sp.]MBW0177236.1 DUF1015 family protein [Sediminibacterium sp.]
MAIIKPFRALRPQPQLAKQVASRPYDVLNSAEAKIEAQGNPSTFLHITKSEIDLPDTTDIHAQQVYEQAKSNLDAFMKREILFRESKECYYIYQLIMNGRKQTGLVCVSSIDDYENDVIRKHEFTRPEKEQDRINHIRISGAQTGNVFLAYRSNDSMDELIEKWKENKSPVYDFTADDDIQHSIWIVNDTAVCDQITGIFQREIPYTYIADGHHRAASAAKVRKALGAEAGPGADYFLTTLFPSSQLQIMDYNRVVKDLNGLSTAAFIQALENKFDVQLKGAEPVKPTALHEFGMYLEGNWYILRAKQDAYTDDPIGVLDVTVLQNHVLDAILNIRDPRTDTRVEFVGGIRGLGELEKKVNSGAFAAAFSLYPVTIDQLFDISDSGNVMPPKSTWFEPKLRDGLLTHLIGE